MSDYPRPAHQRKETPEEYRRRKARRSTATPETTFVENVLTGIWNLLKLLFGGKGSGGTARAAQLRELGENWGGVEMHLMQPGTQGLAVSEADKILDQAFRIMNLPGDSMGARLKSAEKLFEHSLYQNIWEAHKLRNALAHEIGATAGKQEAQWAVGVFRQALTKLGVL